MEQTKNKKFIWDVVFLILFAGSAWLLIWKCRYGFANMDESFYLTVPYRMVQGDSLFAQEWHLTQMAGFLLYPIMKIYTMTHAGMEGIFLTFRYIYSAFQILVTLFIYYRLRKISRPGAICASIVFMLYAPFGIMALSYNSLGIANLAIALVIMCTAKKIKWLQEMIAGLFFAAAVLCCPYLIAVYVVYIIAVVAACIYRKVKGKAAGDTPFRLKSLIFFTIGAAVLAVIFAAYILFKSGIQKVIASLPYILNDSAHETKGAVQLVITYFKSVMSVSKAAALCYLQQAVLFIAALILRIRKNSKLDTVLFAASCVLTAVAIIFTYIRGNYFNFIMYPVCIMAPACALICKDRRAVRLLLSFWIPSMLFTLCIHAASNMEFYAISSAAAVAVVPTLMIDAMCAEEIFRERGRVAGFIAAVCAAVILAGQVGLTTYMKYKTVFWGSMDILVDEPQENGVEKGLYLPESAVAQYDLTQRISGFIDDNYPGEKEMLLLSGCTWIYLECYDKYNASFSAWLADFDETGLSLDRNTMDKLLGYYEINPQKIPDLVFVESQYFEYIDDIKTLADYNVVETDFDGAFLMERKK